MANIKVKELKEALKKNEKNNIKVVDYNGLNLEIKQYIPILEKITLVSSIYESAVNKDNGLHIVLGNATDIAFKNLLVTTYTNITLPKNTMESFNLLTESGLYDFIYDNIPENELLDVQMALNNHIQAKQDEYEQNIQKNNIENIIKEGKDEFITAINAFIAKLPEQDQWGNIVKDISGAINGVDPKALKFVAQAIGWNNGIDINGNI